MAEPCNQYVCLTTFIWHSTSNPKCHVMFSRTKMNVNWHLHFLLKCHLIVTCLLVHVNWRLVFSFTSHTTCHILNCAWQLTHEAFLCKLLLVNCQKLCQKIHAACNLHVGAKEGTRPSSITLLSPPASSQLKSCSETTKSSRPLNLDWIHTKEAEIGLWMQEKMGSKPHNQDQPQWTGRTNR